MYTISDYSKDKAKAIGVKIAPSKYKNYKIDVYDNDEKYITSIGSMGYSDYPEYILTRGQYFADNRRRLYKIRHSKDRRPIHSRGWFADQILW
jgi:hypothetical protein